MVNKKKIESLKVNTPTLRAWSSEAVSVLEFENNGIADSLTGTNAPAVFVQNLYRAVSVANRNHISLSVLTIKYYETEVLRNSKSNKDLSKIQIEMEQELLAGSRAISASLRGGDFFGRMAIDGFWICLQSNRENAFLAATRFEAQIAKRRAQFDSRIALAIYPFQDSTSASSWIGEIDRGYFKRVIS
jgi:GGDEF domain-containing protein